MTTYSFFLQFWPHICPVNKNRINANWNVNCQLESKCKCNKSYLSLVALVFESKNSNTKSFNKDHFYFSNDNMIRIYQFCVLFLLLHLVTAHFAFDVPQKMKGRVYKAHEKRDVGKAPLKWRGGNDLIKLLKQLADVKREMDIIYEADDIWRKEIWILKKCLTAD